MADQEYPTVNERHRRRQDENREKRENEKGKTTECR
jgi:hypothetical protein